MNMIEFFRRIDISVFYFFNHNLSNYSLDAFFSFVTEVRNWMPVYILTFLWLVLLGGKKGRIAALMLLLLVAVTDQFGYKVLKEFFARPRPFKVLADVLLPAGPRGAYSFPSNHALNNFAVAAFLSMVYQKQKTVFFTIASIIAVSRVYLGVHYPSDIIGGAIIGIGFGYLFGLVYRKFSEEKRILIVRTDRAGDVVMITPMIREIRRQFPDAFIAALTSPNTVQILEHNPYLDERIIDDLKKETYWDVVKKIRSFKFTHALLVMPTERAAYQLFLSRIPTRIGVGHKLYEVITLMQSVSRKNYKPLRHEADYCMDLARKIGVETTNIQPDIFVTDDERDAALSLLYKSGVPLDCQKIILHTGSRGSAPNWSEEKYLQFIKELFTAFPNAPFTIILTAFEMSENFVEKVLLIGGNKIVTVAKELKSLRDLISLISVVDLMICSSTGPIHLADALEITCIGIHCHRPMNCPKHWGIINKKSLNIEVNEDNCTRYCSQDQNACGIEDALPVSMVLNEVKKFIRT